MDKVVLAILGGMVWMIGPEYFGQTAILFGHFIAWPWLCPFIVELMSTRRYALNIAIEKRRKTGRPVHGLTTDQKRRAHFLMATLLSSATSAYFRTWDQPLHGLVYGSIGSVFAAYGWFPVWKEWLKENKPKLHEALFLSERFKREYMALKAGVTHETTEFQAR